MENHGDDFELTEVAFSGDVPSPDAERRFDSRSAFSVYRSAMIRWGKFEGLCLIRNISPGGLMGKIYADVPVGERVSVEIREGRPITGQVAWADPPLIGIQFDSRIDVLDVLHARQLNETGLVERMPRLRVSCTAELILTGQHRKVMLIDVSQGGAKIRDDFLAVGDEGVLAIDGLESRRGIIRWADGERAGIAFLAPFAFEHLASWAARHQAACDRGGEP